jgi:signal transduction histidine kinase
MVHLGNALVASLCVVVVISLLLGVVAWWNRSQPGVLWFSAHMAILAVWSTLVLVSFVVGRDSVVIGLSLVGNGISFFLAIGWFLFITEYLGYDTWISDSGKKLVFVGVGGALFLLYSTSWTTELLTGEFAVVTWQGLPIFETTLTVFGQIAYLGLYLLFITGFVLIAHAATVANRIQFNKASILAVGVAVPFAGGILVGIPTVPNGLPVVQVSHAISAGMYAFALRRYDLFRLVPATERVGIERAFNEFGAGVVVIDDQQTVLEANHQLCSLLDTSRSKLVGENATHVFDRFDTTLQDLPTDVEFDNGHYRLTTSPIHNNGSVLGKSVLVIDVTDRRLREQRIDVLNRVLRHNLRNKLGVVLGRIDIAKEVTNGSSANDHISKAETAGEELLEIADKARKLEQVLRTETPTRTVDVREALEDVIETVEQKNTAHEIGERTISITGPNPTVQTETELLVLAFENAIENALVHNDTTEPRIEIAVESTDETVSIRIDDNGPGISQEELTGLEEGEETQLTHTSGLGLWLISWSIASVGGTVTFHNTADGACVDITIPKTTQEHPPPAARST